MTRAKVGVWLFTAVSIISFIAALIPVLKGEQANGVLLFAGVLWLALAIATSRQARTASKSPPAA